MVYYQNPEKENSSLTLWKENRVNFKASSILQPLRQLLKMVAINVEVNFQGLPASFHLVRKRDIWSDIKCHITSWSQGYAGQHIWIMSVIC